MGIRKVLSGYTKGVTGAKLMIFNTVSSFFACSTAGYLNALFMRRTELERGIDIFDKEDNLIGKSKVAAKMAVSQTANSRFLLAVPIFLPSIMLYQIEKRHLMPRNFYLRTLLELLCISFELYIAAPFAISAYPQTATVASTSVEEEFRNLTNARGEQITHFVFNKGL
jgi:ABC-type polysaccharide/polyol phosphate export permease